MLNKINHHRQIILLTMVISLLASCQPSIPEAGTPLNLKEQANLKTYQELSPTLLSWDHLMPLDYIPNYQPFPWDVEDYEKTMAETLANTPFSEEYDGQVVKVSGYVVPLANYEEVVPEFLLVPFLGACIHVPPPPANQIVYVRPRYPLPIEEVWQVISVVGEMTVEGKTSDIGAAGYQMVDPFLVEFDENEYSGIINIPVVVDGPNAPDTPPLGSNATPIPLTIEDKQIFETTPENLP